MKNWTFSIKFDARRFDKWKISLFVDGLELSEMSRGGCAASRREHVLKAEMG
jgi:hypothetical protein